MPNFFLIWKKIYRKLLVRFSNQSNKYGDNNFHLKNNVTRISTPFSDFGHRFIDPIFKP